MVSDKSNILKYLPWALALIFAVVLVVQQFNKQPSPRVQDSEEYKAILKTNNRLRAKVDRRDQYIF